MSTSDGFPEIPSNYAELSEAERKAIRDSAPVQEVDSQTQAKSSSQEWLDWTPLPTGPNVPEGSTDWQYEGDTKYRVHCRRLSKEEIDRIKADPLYSDDAKISNLTQIGDVWVMSWRETYQRVTRDPAAVAMPQGKDIEEATLQLALSAERELGRGEQKLVEDRVTELESRIQEFAARPEAGDYRKTTGNFQSAFIDIEDIVTDFLAENTDLRDSKIEKISGAMAQDLIDYLEKNYKG
jgi:hypothetical protein